MKSDFENFIYNKFKTEKLFLLLRKCFKRKGLLSLNNEDGSNLKLLETIFDSEGCFNVKIKILFFFLQDIKIDLLGYHKYEDRILQCLFSTHSACEILTFLLQNFDQ